MANNSSGGVGVGFILFVVFLVLKLTHTITWSWWWVTCPLWISFALWLVILAIFGIIGLIVIAAGGNVRVKPKSKWDL